ncbi:MAG: DnaA regulatory inactivator Hda [Gammaproteobacteria bacterium]|jgi:DnaA family protein
MTHPQLPLALSLRNSARFDSYFPGANREVVSGLELAAEGRGESLIYIAGAAGTGKTHLLQAACHHAAQTDHSITYLPMRELLDLSPEILEGLEHMDLVCLDDLDVIAGRQDWESGVFDLFNRVRDAGNTLLVAATRRPQQAGFALPDLQSRLGWGVTYVLKPLDEDTVRAALSYYAQRRGLELPEDSVRFLLRRFPRDLVTLYDLLDRLDRAALAAQRRLTIPFIKSVLAAPPPA